MQPIHSHSLPLANHSHCHHHNRHQNSCCCNMYCPTFPQRFESKRNDLKQKLNSMVDELFDFFLNEFGYNVTGSSFGAAPASYQANAGFPSSSNSCQGPPPPPPPVSSNIALSDLSQQDVTVPSSSTNTLINGANQQASQETESNFHNENVDQDELPDLDLDLDELLDLYLEDNAEEEAANNAVHSTQNDNSTIVNLPLQVNLHLKCTDAKCGAMFDTSEQLEHHLAVHHRNPSSSHSSNRQEGSSVRKNILIPSVHRLTCNYCPKQFRSQATLYQHELNFHQPGDYRCNFRDKKSKCSFRAQYRHQLNKHRYHNHSSQHFKSTNASSASTKATAFPLPAKPIYECKWSPDQCKYSSTQKNRVINHIIEHLKQHNIEASPTNQSALHYLEEQQQ